MDYTQFLYMHEELALLAVIIIMFVYDLIVCTDKKSGKPCLNTVVPVVLMTILTIVNAVPCNQPAEAFGGMYQYTPMMTVMKTILNIGTLVVFLMAHGYLRRDENRVKQGEFYLLTLFTLLGMYLMISARHISIWIKLREKKITIRNSPKFISFLQPEKRRSCLTVISNE